MEALVHFTSARSYQLERTSVCHGDCVCGQIGWAMEHLGRSVEDLTSRETLEDVLKSMKVLLDNYEDRKVTVHKRRPEYDRESISI